MKRLILTLLASLVAPCIGADWTVDPDNSHVGFTSVKNDLIAESHSFTRVTGTVTGQGLATITISLASVETLIPIRNERMQSMLFDVTQFPVATITSQIDLAAFNTLAIGESRAVSIDLLINLHGKDLQKPVLVKVVRSGANSYEVSSRGPIIVHASQFALSDGIEALRKIAGLQSIELMVPVTFDLKLIEQVASAGS